MDHLLPFSGTEFEQLATALVTLSRLRAAELDADLVWVFPRDFVAGVLWAYGLPVYRCDGLPFPALAHLVAPNLRRD